MEAECHPCTLVGHSYGGALALQLAVDFSQHTNAIVSLAGTVAPDYQTLSGTIPLLKAVG